MNTMTHTTTTPRRSQPPPDTTAIRPFRFEATDIRSRHEDATPYGDLTRDDILDNITLSWLTNTGVPRARLYGEYNRLPGGGHFAAWEQPQLFSEEVRAGFRSLRH